MKISLARPLPIAAALIAFGSVVSSAAYALDNIETSWNVTVGAGALDRPTYEGSDRDVSRAIPYAELRWSDLLTVGIDGVIFAWNHGDFSAGGGLVWDPGRSDRAGRYFFDVGDTRLRGLQTINSSVGNMGFVEYHVDGLDVRTSLARYSGSLDDGTLLTVDIGSPIAVEPQWRITPHVQLVWANTPYMNRYFGVTAAEAQTSTFSQYFASDGIKDVRYGISSRYSFGHSWLLLLDVEREQLEGDAAKSPLTLARSRDRGVAVLGYRF